MKNTERTPGKFERDGLPTAVLDAGEGPRPEDLPPWDAFVNLYYRALISP